MTVVTSGSEKFSAVGCIVVVATVSCPLQHANHVDLTGNQCTLAWVSIVSRYGSTTVLIQTASAVGCLDRPNHVLVAAFSARNALTHVCQPKTLIYESFIRFEGPWRSNSQFETHVLSPSERSICRMSF